MKILPEIIKEIGLYLLLFIAVSTVAVSEDTHGKFTETIAIFGNDSVETGNNYESTNGETPEISVTIVETPSSEDVDDTNTVEITDSEDSNANDNQDTGVMPPTSNPDELTSRDWSADEWLEWILSAIIGEDIMLPPPPPVEDTIEFTTTDDLP